MSIFIFPPPIDIIIGPRISSQIRYSQYISENFKCSSPTLVDVTVVVSRRYFVKRSGLCDVTDDAVASVHLAVAVGIQTLTQTDLYAILESLSIDHLASNKNRKQ